MKEDGIRFSEAARLLLGHHKKAAAGIVLVCTAIAFAAAMLWPPTYESKTTVQTRMSGSTMASADASSSAAAQAAASIGLSMANPTTMTYVEMMKSDTVLQPIIDGLDWPEKDKEFLTPELFARKYLKVESVKQTNLIRVYAQGRTPEEAQSIAQQVVDNFLTMMTTMNKETQNLLVKFLQERVENAKQEAGDASEKLAAYQKEHQLMSPDDQAKAVVEQMSKYDEAIGKMEVQQQAAQAGYDSASAALGAQREGSQAYEISDNATVQEIRSQIVKKEVERADLLSKYTERHPAVQAVDQQINELHQRLTREVNDTVASNAASLNPAQMKLLQSQAEAQADAATAQASEKALRAQRDALVKDQQNFPDEMVEFLQLKEDAEIKHEVYTNLVKQCEQSRIQQAMDSMDIQVVDPPSMPFAEKPVWPRRKLMTGVGFLVGCVLAFGYGLVLSGRQRRRP
jgi:succinoglycan biosynthesis transport protein ExoP